MFDALKSKILESIEVLKNAEGKLDEDYASFVSASGEESIKTNAYRQLRRFHNYLLGRKKVNVVHKSQQYQRRKRSLGLKADFWTLVFSGVLYKSLRYKVKDGALYAEYADVREPAVKGLKKFSQLEDLIHPAPSEAKEMALAYHRSIVQKFIETWRKKK